MSRRLSPVRAEMYRSRESARKERVLTRRAARVAKGVWA